MLSFFSQSNPDLSSELLASGLMSLLVNIACREIAFGDQWILRDLEVSGGHLITCMYIGLGPVVQRMN